MAQRKRLIAGAIAGATMLAAVLLATGVATAESNGGVRIMPLGDSITDGFNVPGGYRVNLWQSLLGGGFSVDFVGSLFNGPASLGDHDHEGHSGWRIDQLDAAIVPWLQQTTPRSVLLHIGTNDLIQNNNTAQAPARLSALIDKITNTSPTAEVFVATIIPLPSAAAAVTTFNAAIPGIVQSKVNAGRRVHLVQMFPALTSADLADGIHPTAGGYAKMATVWGNALRSVPGALGNGTPTPPATTPPRTTPPATTPAATTPAATTPAATNPPGACAATYRVVNPWPGGFQAEVTVRNTQTSTINGWTVRMTLASGQSIVNLWNGVNTGTSGAISVRNASYNGTLAGSGTTTFGFVANGDGAVTPTSIGCSSP